MSRKQLGILKAYDEEILQFFRRILPVKNHPTSSLRIVAPSQQEFELRPARKLPKIKVTTAGKCRDAWQQLFRQSEQKRVLPSKLLKDRKLSRSALFNM